MDQTMLWIAFISGIGFPVLAFVYKDIFRRQIDDMNEATQKCNSRIDVIEVQAERKEKQTYDAINGQRSAFEHQLRDYVREDLYRQALDFIRISMEEKHKNLTSIVITQYTSLEIKINDSNKNTNDKIERVEKLINEKFSHKNERNNSNNS